MAALLAAAGAAACASTGAGARSAPASAPVASAPSGQDAAVPLIQPGAPGQANRTVGEAQATDLSKVRHTEADVTFMQGMIGHHAQALEMVAFVEARTQSDDMKRLALRIKISQDDEIGMMKRWLTVRGAALPDEHAHHMHGATLMPGMLTQDEMARLAAATGPAFDALFLEYMIKHHEGALSMVKDLFATPGAGQEGDIFAFASDVDADQAMEISRMGAMLRELRK